MERKNLETKKRTKKNNNKGLSRKSTAEKTAKYVAPKFIKAGNDYEYKMSSLTIDDLLNNRRGVEVRKDAQEFLCDFVTEQSGLLGNCVRVIAI